MNTQELRLALAQDSDEFTPELTERVIVALAGEPGVDGLPALGFLPARLQVMVLANLYAAFIEGVVARHPTACVA